MEDDRTLFVDDVEDVNSTGQDADDDAENDVDDEDVETDDDDLDDDDGGDSDDVDKTQKPDEADKSVPVKFTKEQQDVVDKIVTKRLERYEDRMVKDFSTVAGTRLTKQEVSDASRLWGLLKTNPTLSQSVDSLINGHLTTGKAAEPNIYGSRENQLEVKEAILDLKLADGIFRKYSENILDWASDQGYDVDSAKSLKLAYLAWQGSQGKIIDASKKVNEQRRKSVKQDAQKRAGVQSGSSSRGTGRVDYSKMSDNDILSKSGVKLFTDD